jgi:hypothetical protein
VFEERHVRSCVATLHGELTDVAEHQIVLCNTELLDSTRVACRSKQRLQPNFEGIIWEPSIDTLWADQRIIVRSSSLHASLGIA